MSVKTCMRIFSGLAIMLFLVACSTTAPLIQNRLIAPFNSVDLPIALQQQSDIEKTQVNDSIGVNYVNFSHDGRFLASANTDGTIALWEVGDELTLKLVKSLDAKEALASLARENNIDLCLDSQRVHSIGDAVGASVRCWGYSLTEGLGQEDVETYPINYVSFSPDGKSLVAGSGNNISMIFDWESGELLQTFNHNDRVVDGGFIDNNVSMFIMENGQTELLDIASGRLLKTLEHDSSINIRSAGSGKSGELVSFATQDDRKAIYIVRADNFINSFFKLTESDDGFNTLGSHYGKLEGHTGAVKATAFSPRDRVLASIAEDETIRIWEISSGKQLRVIGTYRSKINSMAFSPNGKFLAVGYSNKGIVLWSGGDSYKRLSDVFYDKQAAQRAWASTDKHNSQAIYEFVNAFSDTLPIIAQAKTQAFAIAQSEDSIDSYQRFLNKFPDSSLRDDAVEGIYNIAANKNAIVDYEWFILEYSSSKHLHQAIAGIYNLIANKNNIVDYQWFITQYPNSSQKNQAIKNIYALIKVKNSIEDYQWFIKQYSGSLQESEAIEGIYANIRNKNSIKDYQWFIERYPNSPQAKKAVINIYSIVKAQNSAQDYQWFSDRYANVLPASLRDELYNILLTFVLNGQTRPWNQETVEAYYVNGGDALLAIAQLKRLSNENPDSLEPFVKSMMDIVKFVKATTNLVNPESSLGRLFRSGQGAQAYLGTVYEGELVATMPYGGTDMMFTIDFPEVFLEQTLRHEKPSTGDISKIGSAGASTFRVRLSDFGDYSRVPRVSEAHRKSGESLPVHSYITMGTTIAAEAVRTICEEVDCPDLTSAPSPNYDYEESDYVVVEDKRDASSFKSVTIECLRKGKRLTLFYMPEYSEPYCEYQEITTCLPHERFATLDESAKHSCVHN